MENDLLVIYDATDIVYAEVFTEGVAIYKTPGRGCVIDTKSNVMVMLMALGITDFEKLQAF